jgi:N-formylglutamate deformylase
VTSWLHIQQGDAPLIVSIPHAGTSLDFFAHDTLTDPVAALADTDWHVDRLYAFAADLGATVVRTDISRIVIDVNRDPSGASLYPGQATTCLCPLTSFAGTPLYKPGYEPDENIIADRYTAYFQPYHDAVDAEIARLRRRHPTVIMYDAHSIVSNVPRLFDGQLPQFNIGTNGGVTCYPALADAIAGLCGNDCIVNGRFRGGWITRRCGSPSQGVHTIQMELAQRGYLDEKSTLWDAERAKPLQAKLRSILTICINFAKGQL